MDLIFIFYPFQKLFRQGVDQFLLNITREFFKMGNKCTDIKKIFSKR